jgi:sarcosine oxidase subunit beta
MRPTAFDIVVIGGGVIGTSITYQLARRGARVALLERADLASGATKANGTSVLMQTKTPGPKLALALESLAMFRSLSDELARDVGFVNEGGMIVAETPAECEFLDTKAASLRAHGLVVIRLGPSETVERQPALSNHILGSSYCPDGSVADPFLLTMAWADAAADLGAGIYPYTEVTDIHLRGSRVQSVETSSGPVRTGAVVNACGVWAPAIASLVGEELPILPRRGQISVTEPAPRFLTGKILGARYLLSKQIDGSGTAFAGRTSYGTVLHQTPEGNVMIGSTRSFVGFDNHVTYEAQQMLVRGASRLVPRLRHLHIIRSFAGWRPATPDGLPIIGRSSRVENCYVAAGHEGDGIALAPATGKLVARLITGEVSDDSVKPYSADRFVDWRQPASGPWSHVDSAVGPLR